MIRAAVAESHDRCITRFVLPDERFDSEFGLVSFEEWLECEAERLESKGVRTQIRENGGGRIALERV